VRPIPVANPPNPWHSNVVDYLGDPPLAPLQVFEDHSRSILSKNDSPDLGFTWSVNPYRGCLHACAYCVSGETPILMGDGSTRPLFAVRVGDEVFGTVSRGKYRHYTRTTVLAHWSTTKPAFRVVLEDGTEIIASGDHRFLTDRGWKYVVGKEQGSRRRPHLTINNKMMGTGRVASTPSACADYQLGYLCGMIRGDGTLGAYSYDGRRRARDRQHHFRLALVDLEALRRTRQFLANFELSTSEFVFQEARARYRHMQGIRTHARAQVERIQELVRWPSHATVAWSRGFLAGIFDAEGSYSRGVLRICNTDPAIIGRIKGALRVLGFPFVQETMLREKPIDVIRVRGGVREHLRFFHTVDPAITRKRSIEGQAVKNDARLGVERIEPLGLSLPLYDITTGTGDFIANGVVSHNCYARPTHEYLGFGSGTDFERKIVVKPDAAALLRDAFERRSWKGELIVFSGNTDCYQPLEASYGLTRACLEVCAEYRNPASVITKAPLIERDIELLARLSHETSFGVTISIPFWNEANARSMEPYVATPSRRIKTVKRLAEAGIDVSVNVAPICPGLNEGDMPTILEQAKAAGATHASMTMLRLPGSVKQVFEERIRKEVPLRAERVLARTREVRGGRLNDPRFGQRQTGEGVYAEAIAALFRRTSDRLGLRSKKVAADEPCTTATFRRPTREKAPKSTGQLDLFAPRPPTRN
jgi:DNA repair photolyase